MSNLDEALDRFHLVALEYAGGLANHGPMAVEALERLGHQAKIPALVDLYAPRLPPLERGRPLDDAEWAGALGRVERAPDWVATFEARFAEGDWRATLREALPPLLPGLFAAAGHGWLRAAHAVRALEAEDAPRRRRELALGLAYWAARHQTLPGRPGAAGKAAEGPAAIEASLAAWPLLGEPAARKGFFFDVVRHLDDWPPFAAAVEALPLPAAADAVPTFLDGVCRAAAGLYVRHPGARVAYVHAVTIPSALRLLRPGLADADFVAAAGYAVRAVGALHAIFGDPESVPDEDEEVLRVRHDWAEIRYHAACSLQEHSIKMAEACWREDERAPDPIFARAGADAALKIGGRDERSVC